MRGPRPPPATTVVVSLDRESAERLGLPEKISDWPRAVHARLIERLVAAGAAVIAFDVIFDRPRAQPSDQALAEAITAAGRVVLLQYLREDFRRLPGPDGAAAGLLAGKQLRPPLPAFALGSAGMAPFPLPRETERVSQFFAFASALEGRPTLPAVALQLYALPVLGDWTRLLSRVGLPVGQGELAVAPERLATADALTAYMQTMRAGVRQGPEPRGATARGAGAGPAGAADAPSPDRPDRALRRTRQPLSRFLRPTRTGSDAVSASAAAGG